MTRSILSLALLVCASPAFAAYKAGVASKVITPEQPMWMAGYASRTKPAEGKVHDLFAKALVLEDAKGKRLVLVTTDLIGIPRSLGDEVAAAVEKKYGIKRDGLMLTASHTHCGPVLRDNLSDMYPLTPGEPEKIAAYSKKLAGELVKVVGAAMKALEPASLSFASGSALFAMNRREPSDKGMLNGKNPAGPVDHAVPTLVVAGADGKARAVVFGYACHNTTLSFQQWCGDYAGFAQLEVEKAFPGATAMFWTGCGADANPQPRGTQELCERHGKELGGAVVTAVKGDCKPVSGDFASRFEKITLKLDTLPTRAQLVTDTLSKNPALSKRAERLLKQLDATGKIDAEYPHYPVQMWSLGDQIRWVALGGEVVLDYAIRLKKELPADRTLWVTGYANDVMSYIPSARVLKEGGYEADSSQIYYGMPAKWHSSIEDAIVSKVKQLAEPKAAGPLSPNDERETFRLAKGFKLELVASEPDVVDPVAMCFDERGNLYVAEMRGYPNGGVGTGKESRGRIKKLTDRDGDGVFETCVTFAEGLRFPMGLTPYKGGLLVAVAPDILFLEDTDGDGKADKTTVLYTGFNLANIQQMVNSLQWGLDNWVYGCAGSDGGTITCSQKPDMPPVNLRNRGLRFKPGVPGSLEPTSSGGQYGLTADDYQRWFTATNSQHLRQIVLPDHYLRRNPFLPVSAVTLDIPEHGPAAKVFRISPFEPWRVERTTRRAGSPDAKRFPTTELVPGGYFTSACSPLIYTGELFPKEYYGQNFVCDPANNLIHREVLVENGAVFTAKRVDIDCEFLASTDNWFRPVHLSIGPDGAVYVLDFYREVIETPLSLPDDIKSKLNLESRGRGRIWRITPEGFKASRLPDLSGLSVAKLAEELTSANPWRRLTAQRLLVERQPKIAAGAIRALMPNAADKPGHVNLLWTLHGLGELKVDDVRSALDSKQAGVIEQAVRLAEPFFATGKNLWGEVMQAGLNSTPRVRFQVALSAWAMEPDDAAFTLARVLAREDGDPWIVTAALSSARDCALELVKGFSDKKMPNMALFTRLAEMIGAKGVNSEVGDVLRLIADADSKEAVAAALLDGLGQGMRNTPTSLSAWLAKPPAGSEGVVIKLRARFEKAAATVRSDSPSPQRVAAAGLLALAPFDLAGPALSEAISPTTPGDVQSAAVRGLASHTDPSVSTLLLKNWQGYSPTLKREVLDAFLARPDRASKLLAAIEAKQVAAGELDLARVQQLKSHPNAAVKAKAAAVLTAITNPDRAKVVAEYTAALNLKGNVQKGRGVFKQHCSACHKLDGVGHDVGAILLAALPNKSGEDLLVAVFDPNKEVDPRYVNYQVTTGDGRSLNGVIAAETPTSVTLRGADGKEDVILRANLDGLRSTRLSLMPEGFEKQLSKQDVADLFAYLRIAK